MNLERVVEQPAHESGTEDSFSIKVAESERTV